MPTVSVRTTRCLQRVCRNSWWWTCLDQTSPGFQVGTEIERFLVDTIIYDQNNVIAELSTLTEDEFCMCLCNFYEYCKCIQSAGDFLEGYD